MGIANSAEDIAGKAFDLAKGAGGRVLNSGKAIFNDATEESIRNSKGILGSIAQTRHGVVNEAGEKILEKGDYKGAVKRSFTNDNGNISWGTVAGSYMGAAAVGRVASGGGIYKDRNGQSNLIGVPFV